MKEAELEARESDNHAWLGSRIRFEVLLVAFALYFVYAALAAPLGIATQSPIGKLLSGGMLGALLSASALAVSAHRATRYALLAFLLVVVAMVVVSRFRGRSDLFEVLSHVLQAAFVAWVSLLIIRSIWNLTEANSQAIAAALCAFLMLGLLWALLYSLIGNLDPTAFGPHDLRIGLSEPLTPYYYSFVTLTTLGYGDIVPVSAPARVFAILEAIVGQVFLVVLVARLVGLSVSNPAGRRR